MAPPFPTVPVTVDIIIENLKGDRIVLIERRDDPGGYAIPGGFVEPGESAAQAAIREAKEETGLDVELVEQFHTYSKPGRDPRGPVATIVFIAKGIGTPKAGDDAKEARWHWVNDTMDDTRYPASPRAPTLDGIPRLPSARFMAFDHADIIADYKTYVKCHIRPKVER